MIKKIATLFIVFQLISSWSFAQIDSIKSNLKSTASDSTKVILLNDLAYLYVYRNPDSVYYYGSQSLILAKEINYTRGISIAHLRIGLSFQTRGNLSAAFIHFQKALEMSKQSNDSETEARALANIGLIYGSLEDYKNAIDKMEEAKIIFGELSKRDDRYRIFVYLARYNILLNRLVAADSLLTQSLAMKTMNKRDVWHNHINLAWLNLERGNTQIADSILSSALEAMIDYPENEFRGMSNYFWSKIRQGEGRLEQAKVNASNAVTHFSATRDKVWLSKTYALLSAIAAEKNELNEAYEFLNKSIQIKDSVKSEQVKYQAQIFEQRNTATRISLLQKEKELELVTSENQRNIFIGITLISIVLLMGLGVNIYNKRKDNSLLNQQKKIIGNQNLKLQESNEEFIAINEELVTKQEEISTQRDELKRQNLLLEEFTLMLEEQKKAISNQNDKLEEEVRFRTADLEKHIDKLEQYSFITAHNLRAPLARIKGLVSLMNIDSTTEDDKVFIIKNIATATNELDLVISELNTILQTKDTSIPNDIINLENELKVVLSSLQNEIEASDANIDYDFSSVVSINSVKPFIHSILFNLLSNAIKYRDVQRQLQINVKSELAGEYVDLIVADNGIGMDLKNYGSIIFQMYKRAHTHVQGRGIGLYMVKTQVEQLGGIIDITSVPEQGTTVRVSLKNVKE